MTSPASTSHLGTEFNGFLQAQIYDDKDGGLLSVLSALARLNLDPWKEAADLAQLPREPAIRRLASLLARLPADPSMPSDMSVLAARLIRLLPGRTSWVTSTQVLHPGNSQTTSPAVPNYLVLSMVLVSIVLGLGMASGHKQPASPGNTNAPVSDTGSKQAPGRTVPSR